MVGSILYKSALFANVAYLVALHCIRYYNIRVKTYIAQFMVLRVSKMTNEACFSLISKFANHQISNTEKRHGLNSASAKHLIVRQTLECSRFITLQTRSSQGFPSLILFFFSLTSSSYSYANTSA